MRARRLVVVEGPDVGREFEIAGVLTIGRDRSVGLVLADQEISRRHASVSAEGDGIVVEDLGSTNGTYVNGEQISEKRMLTVGEKVRLGNSVLQLVSAEAETEAGTVPREQVAPETRLHVSGSTKEEAGG